jgi:broad specificity phosphatase PhoE
MSMPLTLIQLRHGESAGNAAHARVRRQGHPIAEVFTEEFVNTPGRTWQLTETGVLEAKAISTWLIPELDRLYEHRPTSEAFGRDYNYDETLYVTPYPRGKQTAGNLGLQHLHADENGQLSRDREAHWLINRALRERDWGDIDTTALESLRTDPLYVHNFRTFTNDALYWRPPGGESIADLSESGGRGFFDTLHREGSGKTVVAVAHGEYNRACHLALTRGSDEDYIRWSKDPKMRIANCEALEYSRITPAEFLHGDRLVSAGAEANKVRKYLAFHRRARPVLIDDVYSIVVTPWEELRYRKPRNSDLLK